MDSATLRDLERALVGDLYLSNQGYRVAVDLVERFGSRFGGSEQERGAGAYLGDYLARLGLHVHTEPFACLTWERSPSVLLAGGQTLPSIALPLCPPGSASGELVFVGDGTPEEFEANAHRIPGNIVLTSTATPAGSPRGIHRVEKIGRAVKLGAAGYIWFRSEPGMLPESGAARWGSVCEIPAVAVSYEVGQTLVRLSRRGPLEVKISGSHRALPAESVNVEAELRGQSSETIVVGAHYDGHDISDGATDDACGVAVVAEVARALAPLASHFRRTVRFVMFAHEEAGFLGASAYMDSHRHTLSDHRLMLNLDQAGRPGRTSLQLQGWPELQSWFRGLFDSMGEEIAVSDGMMLYSDHVPFMLEGIPCAHLSTGEPWEAGRGWGHTAADSLDKLSERAIQADAIKVARLVLRLATADHLPALPKPRAEMKRLLARRGLLEVFELENRPLP